MDRPTDDWTDVEGRRCPWCSAPAAEAATHCSACGASLAQRESLGAVGIPGVTEVDPAVADPEGHDTLEGVMRVERAMTQTGIGALWDQHRGLADLFVDRNDLPPEIRRPYSVMLPLGSFEAPDVSDVGEPSEEALQVAQRLDEEERRAAERERAAQLRPDGPQEQQSQQQQVQEEQPETVPAEPLERNGNGPTQEEDRL